VPCLDISDTLSAFQQLYLGLKMWFHHHDHLPSVNMKPFLCLHTRSVFCWNIEKECL